MRNIFFIAIFLLSSVNVAKSDGVVSLNYPNQGFRNEFAGFIADPNITQVDVNLRNRPANIPSEINKYIGYVKKGGGEVVFINTAAGFGLSDILTVLAKELFGWLRTSAELNKLDEYNVAIFMQRNSVRTKYERVIFVRKTEVDEWRNIQARGAVVDAIDPATN